jgi:Ni,Fe-hydrogenase III large subunit
VRTRAEGDVFARVTLRIDEMEDARDLLRRVVNRCADGATSPDHLVQCRPQEGEAIGCCEGWRGQVLDWIRWRDGVIDRAVIRDPSFCNWPLFAEIGPGNIVPDFPLCNKSLNLSYSGTDM